MNKILCPIDFSDVSLNALEFAVAIGKKFHSRITLLHVFTEKDFNKAMGAEVKGKSFKEMMGIAKGKMEAICRTINNEAQPDGIKVCDYYLELGELIDKVKEVATEEKYDLIVTGTTGVSRTDGIFFGSNTEDMLEDIRKPILCIPENATFKGFNRMVYGSDFLEEDRMAIQDVISLATMFDARIDVVHINLGESDREYKQFTEELKSFITYNKITFLNRRFDNIGDGLNTYMKESGADLLVAFKRKRNIVESIFGKSFTRILSYSTDKPLLVLKLN